MNPEYELRKPRKQMSADALSKMAGQTGAAAVAAALKRASAATGSSFELLYNMARRESSLDPTAKASTSSAAGLFQFIEQTWLGAVKSYGGKHGLAEAAAAIEQGADGRFKVSDATRRAEILDLRYNAEHAAALAGELVQENRASLQKRLGRDPSSAELYAAHFLGAAGAAKLLEAPSETSAATLLPNAAAANKPVFYANGRARTVAEVMASIERSMKTELSLPMLAESPSGSDRLIAGSSMWRQPSRVRKLHSTPNSGVVAPRPPAGSQPSVTAKPKMSTRPIQNVGTEKPSTEVAMIALEAMPSGL